MATIRVDHVSDDAFDVHVRGHVLRVDQKVDDGGADTGPTPTELFVAGLAACVGYMARRFLARHDLPAAGLSVTARSTGASGPARVGRIEVELTLPHDFPQERTDALLAVASRCSVHSSLEHPPEVELSVAAAAPSGA
jgi:putative redox protein